MGGGPYPQLRTGEGFSFKAPSYWTATRPVRINRSLEVPARYLGNGTQAGAKTRMNRSLEVPAQYLPPSEPVSVTSGSDGFDWQDAGIGAAFVAGLGISELPDSWRFAGATGSRSSTSEPAVRHVSGPSWGPLTRSGRTSPYTAPQKGRCGTSSANRAPLA